MDKRTKELRDLERQMEEINDRMKELGSSIKEEVSDAAEDYANSAMEYANNVLDNIKTKSRMMKEKAMEAGAKADAYAHENPWQIAAGGVALGLVLGFLLSRKRR